jgi:nitroreductase
LIQKYPGSDINQKKGGIIMQANPMVNDLFTTLRKRRACRNFDSSKTVPNELLERLIYAAHRAPTGGNIPYRFIIVVKDPIQLKMVKLVSQGLYGNPPILFVICTRTRIGNEVLTKIDIDECTRYDAGAAAENIVLAAYSLGLAASFVKSYSEVGVARVLELPADTRTELIVTIGYPSKEPPPQKKSASAKETFLDKYGVTWRSD